MKDNELGVSIDKCIQRRIDNFEVKVKEDPMDFVLSITQNGYQWKSVNLSRDEAKIVVMKLREHFKF